MDRRSFIQKLGLGMASSSLLVNPYRSRRVPAEQGADVVIIGGGVGGCAAALAAARSGMRVILTEETNWIGGQLTQQAVPPDEHPWIERFGATRAYQHFRKGVRDYYRGAYPLNGDNLRADFLNPGSCGVSRICHEPRVAVAVLERMLMPYVSTGRLLLLLDHEPVRASISGDRVDSIRVRDRKSGAETELQAPYFLDATEKGDLLPLTGTEYVTGAESQDQTGEPHAPSTADPLNMQAITWCFAMDYLEGEDHTIERPAAYDFWRDYVPEMMPPWPGKLLSWTYSNPRSLDPVTQTFDPRDGAENPGFWAYRRLIHPGNFDSNTYRGGMTLVNWPENDYWLGPIFEVSDEEAKKHLEGAMQLSLSLLYWMQTEAPRPDGGAGWPGLRLRPDVSDTGHGLAKRPYIRESRRIKAEFTILEQHVGLEARMRETGLPQEEVTAAAFPDSVGVGSYRIDLHPSTAGDNYIDISSLPFEIPLGALIPQRVENLLAAGKNLGVTHITNGCYRLHPVEWNVGESAGQLAAFCVNEDKTPRQVLKNEPALERYQRSLLNEGIEIHWPSVTAR